jgi:hypothetical protein
MMETMGAGFLGKYTLRRSGCVLFPLIQETILPL